MAVKMKNEIGNKKLMLIFIRVFTLIMTNYLQILIKMRIFYYKQKGVIIGKNFQISPETYIDLHKPEYIEIGDNVQITRWAMILCYDSSQRFIKRRNNPYGKVKIGNNVYIGAHSIIMPGVVIGDNVIIGANSTVTHNIPSNCIVAGSPAKKIRNLE